MITYVRFFDSVMCIQTREKKNQIEHEGKLFGYYLQIRRCKFHEVELQEYASYLLDYSHLWWKSTQ